MASFEKMGGDIDLVLYPAPGRVREVFTPQKVERIRPLLQMQSYISQVRYADDPEGIFLDDWRLHYRDDYNLSDMFASWLGLPHPERNKPWLTVDEPKRVADVVVHRSPRYRWGSRFPWSKVSRAYCDRWVMVGSKEEHETFCREVAPIPYHPTSTLLDLARVIAGCKLFVGNQSMPYWVAVGLMVPTWLEQYGMTTKRWLGYQRVVNHLKGRLKFVQVGAADDDHHPLHGVLNLVGKTTHRQLYSLVYNSVGGLGPTTYLQHICAALDRPYWCVLGGREPVSWCSYKGQEIYGTVGRLDCCKEKACWKSRTMALGDGWPQDQPGRLCVLPLVMAGSPTPTCMELIPPSKVYEAIERHLDGVVVVEKPKKKAKKTTPPPELEPGGGAA